MGRPLSNDRWHDLLTNRYVCGICLTRFFIKHTRCPACHRFNYVRPLDSTLTLIARDDEDLRAMIAGERAFDARTDLKTIGSDF